MKVGVVNSALACVRSQVLAFMVGAATGRCSTIASFSSSVKKLTVCGSIICQVSVMRMGDLRPYSWATRTMSLLMRE